MLQFLSETHPGASFMKAVAWTLLWWLRFYGEIERLVNICSGHTEDP